MCETRRDDGYVIAVLHGRGGQTYSGAKWRRGALVYETHRDDGRVIQGLRVNGELMFSQGKMEESA